MKTLLLVAIILLTGCASVGDPLKSPCACGEANKGYSNVG